MTPLILILAALCPECPDCRVYAWTVDGRHAIVVREADIDATGMWRQGATVYRREAGDVVRDCLSGPGRLAEVGCLVRFDRDGDGDVDLRDYAAEQRK